MEGLADVGVEALSEEVLGLAVGELAGHGDDFGDLEVAVGTDELEDVFALAVAEVHVHEEDVGSELFAFGTGGKGAVCDADFVVGLLDEDLFEDVEDFGFGIDDEDAGLAGLQAVEGDVVLLHEPDQRVERDATVLGAGDAVTAELPGVEPLADGAGCDVTDFCDLTGGEDVFLPRHR